MNLVGKVLGSSMMPYQPQLCSFNWYGKYCNEYWQGKDLEGKSCGQFWGIIIEFLYSLRGNTKVSRKTAHISQT
jgi:hypothetical protein